MNLQFWDNTLNKMEIRRKKFKGRYPRWDKHNENTSHLLNKARQHSDILRELTR